MTALRWVNRVSRLTGQPKTEVFWRALWVYGLWHAGLTPEDAADIWPVRRT